VPVVELIIHLAALVGLGPRPRPAAGSQPPSDARLHWRVEANWHGPGGKPMARSVAALDGGDGGWWLLGEADEAPRPSTATELFRNLCRLLPMDSELG